MVHRQRRLCAEQQHRHGRRSTCTCISWCTQSCLHRGCACTEQHKDEHEAQAGMHAGCSTLTRLVFCSTRFLRVRWDAARASRRTKPSTLWLLLQSPWPCVQHDSQSVVLARARSILLPKMNAPNTSSTRNAALARLLVKLPTILVKLLTIPRLLSVREYVRIQFSTHIYCMMLLFWCVVLSGD